MLKNIYMDKLNTKIGTLYILSVSKGLLSVSFSQKEVFIYKNKYFKDYQIRSGNKINKLVIDKLEKYFERKIRTFNIPIILLGTDFQMRVWNELMKIPYGEVITYKELAKRVKIKIGYQAVGQANSRNPIPIIIPCHRVIAHDLKLGGYSGGLSKKKYLLELENIYL